jgi:hypothetical protein
VAPPRRIKHLDSLHETNQAARLMRSFASWRLGEKKSETTMTENAIAKEIVDAAFRIHTTLGPGLLESVYQTVPD